MGAHYERIPKYEQSSWYFRIYDKPSFEDPFHFHPEFEINYVRHSKGARVVGDSIRRFHLGEVVFLGPNLPHYWYNNEEQDFHSPARSMVCQFKPEFLGENFFKIPEMDKILHLLHTSDRGILFSGESAHKLRTELESMAYKDSFDRLMSLLNMLKLMSASPREDIELLASPGYHLDLDFGVHRRIEQVYELIFKKYQQHLTLDTAAEMACMDRSAFCRFFKKYTGRTFIETLNNFRITEACRILTETNLSIIDTALEVGFHNLTHFYRSFQKYEGMSPSTYRKNVQFNDENQPEEFDADRKII